MSRNYSPVCSKAITVTRGMNVGVSGLPCARPHPKHLGWAVIEDKALFLRSLQSVGGQRHTVH